MKRNSEDESSGGSERPQKCDSCGNSLISFSDKKLEDGKCPYCLGPITENEK